MTYLRKGDYKLGILYERENRFVTYVRYNDKILRCHLPNPGRMVNLLIPGKTELILEMAPERSNRKTVATVIGIKQGSTVINLDTMLFSDLLAHEITIADFEMFSSWNIIAKEKTIGSHRFDFILDLDGRRTITEVKSTTRVVDGIACFPDAVSKRATSHIQSLHKLAEEGNSCMIIFTVYQKADSFQPCHKIDPDFAQTFRNVADSINVVVLQISGTWISERCISYKITGQLPVVE